jgi:hypothetical protein
LEEKNTFLTLVLCLEKWRRRKKILDPCWKFFGLIDSVSLDFFWTFWILKIIKRLKKKKGKKTWLIKTKNKFKIKIKKMEFLKKIKDGN